MDRHGSPFSRSVQRGFIARYRPAMQAKESQISRLGYFLIRIDPPKGCLFKVSVISLPKNMTEFIVTGFDIGDHARLKARGGLPRACLGLQDHQPVFLPRRDQSRPAAREDGLQHPALCPFRITHTPPILKFGGDFDRQSGALENPGGAMFA